MTLLRLCHARFAIPLAWGRHARESRSSADTRQVTTGPVCGRHYAKFRILSRVVLSQVIQMNWRSIRLELGSTGEFPAGSVGRAFLLKLPLDDFDIVDGDALATNPGRAGVRRHWSTEPDERGQIVASGENWAMRCPGKPDRVFRLDGTPIRLGQHVSVVEPDGTVLPLKVASIR